MPALQNLSILDRQATPVAHVFTPKDVKDGVGLVVKSSGVPASDEKLTVSMRKSGQNFRGKLTLAVPVVATQVINGISSPAIIRTAYATVDFTFHETSSTAERNDLVGMLADSLGTSKTLVNNAIVGLEGIYG
jgi:hypothetical protein